MKKMLQTMKLPNLHKQLKELNRLIRRSKAVIIAGHISPDGDDISCQLALGEYLKSIHKKFVIAWYEAVPKSLQFLPNVDLITRADQNPIDPKDYDLMIVVDSGDIKRIGQAVNLVGSHLTLVNIDHHQANTNFGDFNLVVEKACSIGEILYYFFKFNHIKITYNIAVNLYVSIVTDCGSFRYDSVHPEVHLIAADLLRLGIVPSDFYINLYQNKSQSFINLLTLVLTRMELFHNGQIAVSQLIFYDFENEADDETDGMIEYLGMLETVSVYLLIKEKAQGAYTASIRSKFNVDVAKAASIFNGGGHMRAAGCRTDKMTLENFKLSLIQEIGKQL